MKTLLIDSLKKLNIDFSEKIIDNFLKYMELLKEWNKKINLTSITDDYEIIIKHFVDSLTIEKYIPVNAKVIDVGTGAGFPGIPLKIVREDIDVVLLDSLNKRINFLNEVINECGLKKIKTIHGRAEDIAHNKEYREAFDVSTARAVANIATLSEYCTPFLKINGIFICMKGEAKEEIEVAQNAIKILGMKIEKVEQFKLEEIDANRTIVIYKKEKNTPAKYPRKAGIPTKEPLL